MVYTYNICDETIQVYVWEDNIHNFVSVRKSGLTQSVNRKLYKDKDGHFFKWKSQKVYLNTYEKITLTEFNLRLNNNDCVTTSELCIAILTEGIENVRFALDKEINDTVVSIVYKIDTVWNKEKNFNYEYKLRLIPTENSYDNLTAITIYTCALLSLLRNGSAKIVFDELEYKYNRIKKATVNINKVNKLFCSHKWYKVGFYYEETSNTVYSKRHYICTKCGKDTYVDSRYDSIDGIYL